MPRSLIYLQAVITKNETLLHYDLVVWLQNIHLEKPSKTIRSNGIVVLMRSAENGVLKKVFDKKAKLCFATLMPTIYRCTN